MEQATLILASASPRRRELLAALGLEFRVGPTGVDEHSKEPDPRRLASELALRKARAAAATHPHAPILAADTIVVLGGRVLGKPDGADEAAAMLGALRGRRHEVVSAVAVARGGRDAVEAATTAVTMRDYGDAEIARFIARGEPFDKAGGYAVQDAEFAPAARVEGCLCAVIGLPLWTARGLLASVAGLETAAPALDRCAACPLRA